MKHWSIKSEGSDWWLVHDEVMHGIHIKELSFEGFKPYVVNKIVWNHDKTQRGVIMEVFDWRGTDQVDVENIGMRIFWENKAVSVNTLDFLDKIELYSPIAEK